MIASMEGKIQQMANQLTEQVNIYKELEHKYHTSEAHAIELERKLKSLDSEYCATEVLRNNLKSDHLKVRSYYLYVYFRLNIIITYLSPISTCNSWSNSEKY